MVHKHAHLLTVRGDR